MLVPFPQFFPLVFVKIILGSLAWKINELIQNFIFPTFPKFEREERERERKSKTTKKKENWWIANFQQRNLLFLVSTSSI